VVWSFPETGGQVDHYKPIHLPPSQSANTQPT